MSVVNVFEKVTITAATVTIKTAFYFNLIVFTKLHKDSQIVF